MDHDYYPDDNKQWAKEYLLDPLYGPEPSQECGPGSSFITSTGIARQISVKNKGKEVESNTRPNRNQATSSRKEPADRSKPLPDPPAESPSRFRQRPRLPPSHPSSPPSFGTTQRTIPEEHHEEDTRAPLLRKLVTRSKSVRELLSGPSNPRRYPPPTSLTRSKTVHTIRPAETSWNRGTILTRSNSVTTTGDSIAEWATAPAKPTRANSGTHRPSLGGLSRSKSVITTTPRPRETLNRGATVTRSASVRTAGRPATPNKAYSYTASPPVTSPVASPSPESPKRYQLEDRPMASPVASNNPYRAKMEEGSSTRPKRSGSLSARFEGDMSHRPLAMLKEQHRAADRNPYNYSKKHRHVKQPSDTIDGLDSSGVVGVPYHHDGPYDPTLADRNTHNLYPPIEAVRDSNMEALKATPRENIQDSLTKHVPLQGTAVIPSGMPDMSGRTMEYEEGADLMREKDAAGGAYKRYDFIPYRDDDLKGKGEPSYTLEKELRDQRANEGNGTVMYEMQPQGHKGPSQGKAHGSHVRQRSISNADKTLSSTSGLPMEARATGSNAEASNSGVSRRNTTGKSKLDGLKRRIGSLRHKKLDDDYV